MVDVFLLEVVLNVITKKFVVSIKLVKEITSGREETPRGKMNNEYLSGKWKEQRSIAKDLFRVGCFIGMDCVPFLYTFLFIPF